MAEKVCEYLSGRGDKRGEGERGGKGERELLDKRAKQREKQKTVGKGTKQATKGSRGESPHGFALRIVDFIGLWVGWLADWLVGWMAAKYSSTGRGAERRLTTTLAVVLL